MNNIFENAYFGKPYKTRDGRKAIYLGDINSRHEVCLITEQDGKMWVDYESGVSLHSPSTIVSEWQEPVNEEELDELAMIKYPCKCSPDETYCDCCINSDLKEAYKAGCKEMFKRLS